MLDTPVALTSVIITPLTSPALVMGSNGILKLHLDKLPSPSEFSDPVMISIPPMQLGGNHKHLHRELFLSLDDFLELYWIDGYGCKHQHKMRENNQAWLFEIPSGVPHAIVNTSENSAGTVVEFADGPPQSVEYYPVLCSDGC